MLGNCVGGGMWKGWGKEKLIWPVFIWCKSKSAIIDLCFWNRGQF